MKVDLKRYRIEKAASKNERRPVLQNVFYDAPNGVLVATDSHVMAVVPVEMAFDDATGAVPVEAVVLARKDQAKGELAEIVANGTVSVRVRGERAEFERSPGDYFPDWMPFFKRGLKPVTTFALNPRMLMNCAEAVGGAGGVSLEFFGPDKPIRVRALYDETGAKGIVMPIKQKDNEGS